MKKILLTAAAVAFFAPFAFAQAPDATKAYIDAGFAAMDFNKDGKVTRAEFDRFMRERLARQAAAFDAAFAQLDADSDGKISKAEAEANTALAQHFAEVDSNSDGFVNKDELRTAMLNAQVREQGIK